MVTFGRCRVIVVSEFRINDLIKIGWRSAAQKFCRVLTVVHRDYRTILDLTVHLPIRREDSWLTTSGDLHAHTCFRMKDQGAVGGEVRGDGCQDAAFHLWVQQRSAHCHIIRG